MHKLFKNMTKVVSFNNTHKRNAPEYLMGNRDKKSNQTIDGI